MHIELIESRAQTDRMISGIARAMGAEDAELVNVVQMRQDFDDYLNAPPEKPMDADRLELLQVLGIAK